MQCLKALPGGVKENVAPRVLLRGDTENVEGQTGQIESWVLVLSFGSIKRMKSTCVCDGGHDAVQEDNAGVAGVTFVRKREGVIPGR